MSVLETIPEKYIVLFVTLFITFLQLTANFYILGPALGGWFSLRAQKVLSPLTISLVSLYVNYYLACKTSPGYVPEGWEPPKELLEYDEELPVGYTGPRFCKKCDSYKPPRAHHCRHCGRCILRMDHHCPWIGNCVGFGNYAYFVRFVFSVEISCTYGIYLLLWRLQRILEAWNNMWVVVKPSLREAMLSIFVIVCAGIVTLAVGVLAIYHTYCLIKGQTTIEGSERTKTKRLIRRGKIYPVVFPFDVGFYQNICDVLGNNPLLWWWPSPCPGDGISYHVKPHTDPLLVYSWPPRDPASLGQFTQEDLKEEENWEGSEIVRRDSEGFLVKEITMEDRMRMLYASQNFESEHPEHYQDEELTDMEQPHLHQETEVLSEEEEEEAILDENDKFYYDSNSVTSSMTDYDGKD